MLRLLYKKREEQRRKKIKKKLFLLIKELEIKKNTRHNLKLKESKMRRKEKFKDSESFKRRLPIDKLKLML